MYAYKIMSKFKHSNTVQEFENIILYSVAAMSKNREALFSCAGNIYCECILKEPVSMKKKYMSSAKREMVNMQLQFNATSSFISMCICVCWVTRSLNSKLFYFLLTFLIHSCNEKKNNAAKK